MNLDDALESLASPGDQPDGARATRPTYPQGWEPGVAWDGQTGQVTTGPMAGPPADWGRILEVWNLDPAEVEIIEPVQLRAWDAPDPEGGIRRMFYYRAQVRRRRAGLNAEDLLAEVRRWKPRPPADFDGHLAFLYALGDTQIGKPDGDGTTGTVDRVLTRTQAAAQRLKDLRRLKRPISQVYLPQLGDCIEGFNSQGGRLAFRNELTLTEQIRVYRRLLLEVIRTFAPLADQVIVPVVPGNHDEAVRIGDKMATRYDDSFAIEAASAVQDALALHPSGFGHVSFVFPKKDELTVTLDVAGTIVGFAHGHQTRGKAHDWWAKQGHGMQPIGDATLLITAHYHHLRVEQQGAKTWIQIPAMDGGSTWYRHQTGQDAPAGALSLVVGEGSWGDLAIL